MSCCSRYYNGIIPQLQNMQLTSYLYTWKNASFHVPHSVKTYGQMYSFSCFNFRSFDRVNDVLLGSYSFITRYSLSIFFCSLFISFLPSKYWGDQGSVFSPLFPLCFTPQMISHQPMRFLYSLQVMTTNFHLHLRSLM